MIATLQNTSMTVLEMLLKNSHWAALARTLSDDVLMAGKPYRPFLHATLALSYTKSLHTLFQCPHYELEADRTTSQPNNKIAHGPI